MEFRAKAAQPKAKKLLAELEKLKRDHRDERLLSQTLVRLANECQLLRLNGYTQHGGTSCMEHSFAVAYYSLAIANRFRIRCNRKSLIIGALLHDYFLYDWHHKKLGYLHGFKHGRSAMENAQRDLTITGRESDIIKKHMFPLTVVPPRYREGYIVCLADKYCSLMEVFRKTPYKEILRPYYKTGSFEKLYGMSEQLAERLNVPPEELKARITRLAAYAKENIAD